MSTIAMHKDDDFCDYTYDVAPKSLSLWQRLSTIKVELESELEFPPSDSHQENVPLSDSYQGWFDETVV